jgi:sec-independent protein translocase protein TatA
MPNIGPMELVVVLVVALLVLGPKRLPSAGRALGESMRGFKDSLSGRSNESDSLVAADAEDAPNATVTPTATPAQSNGVHAVVGQANSGRAD